MLFLSVFVGGHFWWIMAVDNVRVAKCISEVIWTCIDLRTVHDSTCFYNSFGETSENSQPILVGGFNHFKNISQWEGLSHIIYYGK
jgi:hypothetical protein